MAKNNWTREELIVALYWYCTKIPFTKVKFSKPEVIELAEIVGRTPSAAAFKLVNFARFDLTLQKRGVKGMSRGSNAEEPIWNEFYNNWSNLAFEAEKIIAKKRGISIEEKWGDDISKSTKLGKEKLTLVKVRINQNFFRSAVLLSYNSTCCITGIKNNNLLIASHIKPWSKDLTSAANPQNGLCLNALHDKAFDKGLMTITPDFKIKFASSFQKEILKPGLNTFFLPFQNKKIMLPRNFIPAKEFLEYHNDIIFVG